MNGPTSPPSDTHSEMLALSAKHALQPPSALLWPFQPQALLERLRQLDRDESEDG